MSRVATNDGADTREAQADHVDDQGHRLRDLMRRYAKGDQEAFEQIFATLHPRVYRYHLRSTRRPEVAEDLTQRTFMKLHVARRRYRSGAPVRPWVFAIAKNVQRDLFRKLGRSNEQLTDDGEPEGVQTAPSAFDDGRDVLMLQRLEAALDALPQGQRDVIMLHKFEGLTMEQVARALRIGVSAAKVRAHRGYAALRKTMTRDQK